MTEENARPADADPPEVPPAGDSDARSMPPALPGPAAEAKEGPQAVAAAKAVAGANAVRLGRWVRRQKLSRAGAAAAVLVVVGLLAWLLVSALAGPKSSDAGSSGAAAALSAPASRGQLPLKDVIPLDFRVGDCLEDFDPDAPQSTVVDCATGHSAQLVAIEQYATADDHPGRDALKLRARDACKATPLVAKSSDYDLSYKLAYPSSSSWEKGDRRVDCYVVADKGNAFQESLLP